MSSNKYDIRDNGQPVEIACVEPRAPYDCKTAEPRYRLNASNFNTTFKVC